MVNDEEITAKEIIGLLYHAYSVEVWELGDAARRKWYKKYQGTDKANEVIVESATMIVLREWQLRANEAEGKDCAQMLAEQEAQFNAQMKEWVYEGLSTQEADEVWSKWIEDEKEFHLSIEEAIQKARKFVASTA